jgi:hypothetical protein
MQSAAESQRIWLSWKYGEVHEEMRTFDVENSSSHFYVNLLCELTRVENANCPADFYGRLSSLSRIPCSEKRIGR